MKSWKNRARFCRAICPDIELGRGAIEQQITERARQKIEGFGIELLDERFKRSKYNPAVAEKIIERMSSERHQIASKFRSEGRGEAANISGQKESDVASIQSDRDSRRAEDRRRSGRGSGPDLRRRLRFAGSAGTLFV